MYNMYNHSDKISSISKQYRSIYAVNISTDFSNIDTRIKYFRTNMDDPFYKIQRSLSSVIKSEKIYFQYKYFLQHPYRMNITF